MQINTFRTTCDRRRPGSSAGCSVALEQAPKCRRLYRPRIGLGGADDSKRRHPLCPARRSMRMIRTVVGVALLLILAGWRVTADDKVFFMELPRNVLPSGVGGNAFAVAGSYFNGGGMYWMPTSGDRAIGGRAALAISRDGKAIVGSALDSRALENAAIWQGGRNWRVLGSFSANSRP